MYVCLSKFHLKSKIEQSVLSAENTLLYTQRKFDLPIVTMEVRIKWNQTDANKFVLSNAWEFIYLKTSSKS
jgi:hypothetical protein